MLLALVLWAGAMTGWRGGRTWLWLSGAFAVAAAGDIALHVQLLAGGYDEASLINAAFPLAMMAVAVAGAQPGAPEGARRTDTLAVPVLPSACVLILLGLLLRAQFVEQPAPAQLLALAAMAVALVRGTLTFRELRKLHESRRFQRGFEEATIGMAIAGPDLRWIRVNAALARLLGYEPHELVGRCALDLTHPEDVAVSVNLHDGVIAGGQPAPLEKRLMHRDGTPIPLLLTTALVDGEDGMHFFTQLQDLRDRHRADGFSRALAELSRVALEIPDVPALMRRVMEIVEETANADSACVVLRHEQDGVVHIITPEGAHTGTAPEMTFGPTSQTGHTLAVDEAVVANDLPSRDTLRTRCGPARERARPRPERADPLRQRRRRAGPAPDRAAAGVHARGRAVRRSRRERARLRAGPRARRGRFPPPRAARPADRPGEPRLPGRPPPPVAGRRRARGRRSRAAAARPRPLQGRQRHARPRRGRRAAARGRRAPAGERPQRRRRGALRRRRVRGRVRRHRHRAATSPRSPSG